MIDGKFPFLLQSILFTVLNRSSNPEDTAEEKQIQTHSPTPIIKPEQLQLPGHAVPVNETRIVDPFMNAGVYMP